MQDYRLPTQLHLTSLGSHNRIIAPSNLPYRSAITVCHRILVKKPNISTCSLKARYNVLRPLCKPNTTQYPSTSENLLEHIASAAKEKLRQVSLGSRECSNILYCFLSWSKSRDRGPIMHLSASFRALMKARFRAKWCGPEFGNEVSAGAAIEASADRWSTGVEGQGSCFVDAMFRSSASIAPE